MTDVTEANKAAAARFWQETLTNQNFALIPKLLASNYQYNGHPMEQASLVGWIKGLHAQFPGLQFVIETILAENDSVALRWRMNVPQSDKSPAGYVRGTNILVFALGQCISNDQNDGVVSGTFIPLKS